MKTKTATDSSRKPQAPSSGLRVGDVIEYQNMEYVVWYSSESRASVAPLDRRIRCRIQEETGKIQFLAKDDSENISVNSEVTVLRSLGRKGLKAFLEEKTTTTATADSADGKNKTKHMGKKDKKAAGTETKTRAGKLGGYKGHSITSTIRAFGKAGWSLDEARAFFVREKIAVADTTIKIQLRAGKLGEGGDPADFSQNQLKELKPKVAAVEKTTKAKGKGKTEEKPKAKAKGAKKGKKPAKTEETDEEAASEPKGEEAEEETAEV